MVMCMRCCHPSVLHVSAIDDCSLDDMRVELSWDPAAL